MKRVIKNLHIGLIAIVVLLANVEVSNAADKTPAASPRGSQGQMDMGQMDKMPGMEGMMRGAPGQRQEGPMSCCGPGMMSMMGHGTMIGFSILVGVLIASISAAFIALAVFLFRRSHSARH